MKPKTTLIIFIMLCLATIIIGSVWAISHIESLFAYRSPLDGNPPPAGEPLGAPLTRRLVIVLVDALRDDTSRDTNVMPELNRLRALGASATTRVGFPSYSQPGYGTILTGAWPEINSAPPVNAEYADIPRLTQDEIFSAARRAGYGTALSGFNWFEKLLPPEALSASYFTAGEDATADRAVVDAALSWLESADYGLVLIHIDQVDYAGHHEGGAVGEGWRAAASRSDDLIKEISSRIDFSKDTLLILSDHGQVDRGGHGGNEPQALAAMFVLTGRGVKPGEYGTIDLADTAPTAAALLGISIPASAQGRARVEMLTLNEGGLTRVNMLESAQKSTLSAAYKQAIGQGTNEGTMESSRESRINKELFMRGLWITPLFLVVIYALIRFTVGEKLILFVLAAAAIGIFYVFYAVVDGYSCSLSAVEGMTQILGYFGTRGALSIAFASLSAFFLLRLWRRNAVNSATQILHISLLAAGLLVLPVLYSTWLNGWQATWMLPEPNSAYYGMSSAILAAVFGASALPLAGISALVSALNKKARVL